jgi:hypothetical protein
MAEFLIRSFKETVESGMAAGEIDGINDENLEKLQEYLQETIRIVSRRTEASLEPSSGGTQEDYTQDSGVFESSSLPSQVNKSLPFTPRSLMTISPPIPPPHEVAPAQQGVEPSAQNQPTINAATAVHIQNGSKPYRDTQLGMCTV